MPTERVNVSVADDHLDRFTEVVRRMEQAGLKVEEQLEQVGIVSGSIDSAKLADLDRVQGVGAVERSRRFQIAPPESEIQ
jgi:hypothetical protein